MEEISYISGLIWYSLWPIVIYISYKFAVMNIEHLENNLERNDKL